MTNCNPISFAKKEATNRKTNEKIRSDIRETETFANESITFKTASAIIDKFKNIKLKENNIISAGSIWSLLMNVFKSQSLANIAIITASRAAVIEIR